jgi:hypothetical protein
MPITNPARAKASRAARYAVNGDKIRAANAAYRKANRERTLSVNKEYRARMKAAQHALKSFPCADCGGVFDPVCMDFDHRPGEAKIKCVAKIQNIEAMKAEAAKCDLVCANCHRIRTYRKRDHAACVRAGKGGR